MKRTIFGLATILVVFLTVFAVLAVHPVRTVKAHRGCSDRTLSGNYGLAALGAQTGGNFSFSMLATFDGKGGFTGSSFNTVHPPFVIGPNYFTTGGSYTVNSDCTATFTIPAELPSTNAVTLDGIVVDTGGTEVAGTWYDVPDEASGTFDIKKVPDRDSD